MKKLKNNSKRLFIIKKETAFRFMLLKNLILSVVLLLALPVGSVYGQKSETNTEKSPDLYQMNSPWQSSRGYSLKHSAKELSATLGLAKYFRFTYHDGNLVNGGVTNSGLLSYHYVDGCPRISWPKGVNNVSYIHGAVFFVAGLVVDAHGDTIPIVSDNYRRGNVEQAVDQSHWYAFMPLPKYFNNHQPNSVDWDMGGISEDVGIDGIPNSHDEGEGDNILQPQEDFNNNGKLDKSMLNNTGWFAINDRQETWPEYWPAQSYPGDDRAKGEERPGVRAGRWNGAYGAYARADQESYYVMDDRENDEFDYNPFDDDSSKLPWPNGRHGLGVTVEVRHYQWAAPLAEDILICIYNITNYGKKINKAVVGMLVDPDLGGDLSGDDASFDDLSDITYAWNKLGIANNGLPTGYFGFAFLESPGIPDDGIDNDKDGMIDESQTNGIDDDHDWKAWEDLNGNGIWDNEDVNFNGRLDPGEDLNGNGFLDWEPLNEDIGSDGLGPGMDGYTGPDGNGTEANGVPDLGEPKFELTDNDESDQVGLTSFYLRDVDNTMADDKRYWDVEIHPGVFTVRPGFQRDITWSYGSGYVELKTGTGGTQKYAIALLFGNDKEDIIRNKKTMQVIYDNDYNFAKPPRKPFLRTTAGDGKVILQWDDRAESSYDPIYGNDFEAYYIYKSTEPTFGDIKTITDAFGNPFLFKPLAIFDKKDGLFGVNPVRIGSEIGPESDLGVSYNMGSDSGLQHDYVDTAVTNGRTYYYAVVSIDKGYDPSFYPKISDREGLLKISPTPCSANIQTDLLGRAISTDVNTAIVTPMEYPAGYVVPALDNSGMKHISGFGTGSISIDIFNDADIVPNTKYKISFGDDSSFAKLGEGYFGLTDNIAFYNVTDNYLIKSVLHPVKNDYLGNVVYDGFKVVVKNDTLIEVDSAKTGWIKGKPALILEPILGVPGTLIPRDFEVRVMDEGADTSINRDITNFQVWDVTNPDSTFQIKYRFRDSRDSLEGVLSEGDRITLTADGSQRSWNFQAVYPENVDSSDLSIPKSGDVFKVVTLKPFDRQDIFEFTVIGNEINSTKTKTDLNDIYTVPDPYIAASSLERKVINQAEGRGDRRIDFVNLPNQCTITIFTTSGKLVRKLEHNSTLNQSRESWDLRTKDGLEITHGIYYYVVEAPGIGKKVGRLAVIK